MQRRIILAAAGAAALGALARFGRAAHAATEKFPFTLSDAAWRQRLSPAAYNVLRQEGTEPPFTSALLHEAQPGRFACAGCGQPAFDFATKYDSGTGWPSFWDHLPKAIAEREDDSFGMQRTEVHCSNCGGHLGHVFPDGPQPTGLRYCMNGVALSFTARSA